MFCPIFKILDQNQVLVNFRSDLLRNEVFLKSTVKHFQHLKSLDRSVLQTAHSDWMNMQKELHLNLFVEKGFWLWFLGRTEIIFRLYEHHMKHLTRILQPHYNFSFFKDSSHLIRWLIKHISNHTVTFVGGGVVEMLSILRISSKTALPSTSRNFFSIQTIWARLVAPQLLHQLSLGKYIDF